MNIIAKWILESVAATVVIMVCIGVPQALNLPTWTLALSVVPIVLYLSWRLDGQEFAWRRAAVFAAILGALLLIQQVFLPQSWHTLSTFIIVFTAAWVGSYLRRRQKETHHAA